MVEGESNSLACRLGRVTVPPGLGLESPADLDGRSELRRPGTPASPVKPMNSPLSRCSRAQRPKPLGSNRSSNSSMSASLSRRVSGAWKCSMTRGSAFIVANGTRSSSRQLRRSSRSVVSVVATGSGCPTDPTYADLLEQQAVVDPVGRRLPFCGLALTAISPLSRLVSDSPFRPSVRNFLACPRVRRCSLGGRRPSPSLSRCAKLPIPIARSHRIRSIGM
jgi:hypothetical protein